jgi:hypothetical protein
VVVRVEFSRGQSHRKSPSEVRDRREVLSKDRDANARMRKAPPHKLVKGGGTGMQLYHAA